MNSPPVDSSDRIATRFVAVLGKGGNMEAWTTIHRELDRAGLFFITNIDEISAGSISSLNESDVLTNLNNPLCTGLIVFQSDAYFNYLEKGGGAEKAIVFAHLQARRPTFSVVGPDAVTTPRVEFNLNRTPYRRDLPMAFTRSLRAWLQDTSIDTNPASDFHPEVLDILQASFGSDVRPESDDIDIKADGVRYSLYTYEDVSFGTTHFVLYLPAGMVLPKTASHLKANYDLILTGRPLLILIDPKADASRAALMTRVRRAIPCSNCMFLDDFLQTKFNLSSIISNGNTAHQANVIQPRLRPEGEQECVEDPFEHLTTNAYRARTASPITLIKGQGGVGKTTLLKQLAHQMAQPNSETGNLIILSAPTIIQNLALSPDLGSSFTLFNLLRASVGAHNLPIGEKQFAWIFDTGRVSVAIDGIDEIIPRLSGPDAIQTFFESVINYSSHLRRGRLFLTCRSSEFVRSDAIAGQIEEYDLLLFEEGQIDEYIDARFARNINLKPAAHRFVEDLISSRDDATKEILPFILRVVCDSVEDGDEWEETRFLESASEILEPSTKRIDYVLFKVCDREEAKYEYSRFLGDYSSIDMQCNFFVELAINYHGSCSEKVIHNYLKGFSLDFDDQTISRFYHHPLLLHLKDTRMPGGAKVSFKDDAINELFLAIGFARALSNTGRQLKLASLGEFADKSHIGSPFVTEVVSRVHGNYDDYILRLNDLIVQARLDFYQAGKREEYFRYSAGLLNIALQLATKNARGAEYVSATQVLCDLFADGAGTLLAEAAIHNVPGSAKVVFDFAGLTLIGASVMNYDGLARCSFDDHTRFNRSRILTGMSSPRKTSARLENFVDCQVDDVFTQSMAYESSRRQARLEDAIQQLRNVLQRFRINGHYNGPREFDFVQRAFRGHTGLTFSQVVEICIRAELMTSKGTARVELELRPEVIESVTDFVDQRIYRGRISKAINAILQHNH